MYGNSGQDSRLEAVYDLVKEKCQDIKEWISSLRESVNKHHKPTIDIKGWKIIISNTKNGNNCR